MNSNLNRYKNDLEKLIYKGETLQNAMQFECSPEEFEIEAKKVLGDKRAEFIKALPKFANEYQVWYSESLVVIKLILPDRLNDFIKLYEKPIHRKSIEYGNYVIEDYLQNLRVTTSYGEIKVRPEAAIPQFNQQLNILKSIKERFESSLFDINQLVQADLFDTELEEAEELNTKGFTRAAGAIAGVVLEAHLLQICKNHDLKFLKKDPAISDLNNLLKENNVVDTPNWRYIQRLTDLRNKCDHKKQVEPSKEEVIELIGGVSRVLKTVF